MEQRPRPYDATARSIDLADCSPEAFIAAVDRAARFGAEALVLEGAEPLDRADLLKGLRRAHRHGLKVTLRTNGRRLAYPQVIARLLATGAALSIQLQTPPTPWSTAAFESDWSLLVAALRNMDGTGIAVTLETTWDGVGSLEVLSTAVTRLKPHRWWLSCAPDVDASAEAWPEYAAAIKSARDRLGPSGIGFSVAGLPLCLAPALVHTPFVADPKSTIRFKPPECAGCALRTRCSGIVSTLLPATALPWIVPSDAVQTGDWPVVPEEARVDISPRYPRTALLTLIVARCHLNCVFCDVPQGNIAPQVSRLPAVLGALRAMRNRADRVFLTGGEPTILPWLLEVIAAARAMGYRDIQMQSHAGLAADPNYADALVAAGLTAIDVPIYGADAVIHERVTHTPQSFENTHAGLRALQDRGVKSVAHATIFAEMLPELSSLIDHIATLNVDAAYLQLAGDPGPRSVLSTLAPSPNATATALKEALSAPRRIPLPDTLFIADLPPCMMGEFAARVLAWKRPLPRAVAPVVLPFGEWLMTFSMGATRIHPAECGGCAWRERCDGLPADAFVRHGAQGIRPIRLEGAHGPTDRASALP